jgi:hypothetical protein
MKIGQRIKQWFLHGIWYKTYQKRLSAVCPVLHCHVPLNSEFDIVSVIEDFKNIVNLPKCTIVLYFEDIAFSEYFETFCKDGWEVICAPSFMHRWAPKDFVCDKCVI